MSSNYFLLFFLFAESQKTRFEELTNLTSHGENFCESFEQRVEKLQKKNDKDLIDLLFLRQSYERLMTRLDLYKEHQTSEKKKKIKIARNLKKKKFDKVILDSMEKLDATDDKESSTPDFK